MVREVVKINEELCDGCGLCVPECHEGALQVIDGKARLVSDLMCDGLGACLGHCPQGAITIEKREAEPYDEKKVIEIATGHQPSELRQWPVQMHLVNPVASCFKNSDVLIAADCTAFTIGGFHSNHLRGKSLAIACPKLDTGTELYVEKIRRMIDEAKVNTITVMIMQVPCCMGLLQMVRATASRAQRKVPVKLLVVGIEGEILKEEWSEI